MCLPIPLSSSVTFSLDLLSTARLMVTKTTGTISSYEIILLIADATKVFPSIEFVVTDEVCIHLLSTPFVDEFGDKVNTRFNSEHEARLERTCQAKRLTANLSALGLSVVAYPYLAQIFHIMHIESHHMS